MAIFQDSLQQIKETQYSFEQQQRERRKTSKLEFYFILFSILIMIPYEIMSSYVGLLILGGLNLICDLIFVFLLYHSVKAYQNKQSTKFLVITDFLAAIPGLVAIMIFIISVLFIGNFHIGEFLAGAGLIIPTLKTTRLLRLLRLTRLFRIMRNVKALRLISLSSESVACERVVGWLGLLLLIIFITMNLIFQIFGPLAIQENSYYKLMDRFSSIMKMSQPQNFEEIFSIVLHTGLSDKLVYIKFFNEERYYNLHGKLDPDKARSFVQKKYCSLNSTKLKFNQTEILFDDKEIFQANKRYNFIWILSLTLGVFLFSFITTFIIGHFFTDDIQKYIKSILASYEGEEVTLSPKEVFWKTDKETLDKIIKLYINDFVHMLKTMDEFEGELKLKEQEKNELQYTIKKLENDIQNDSVPEDMQALKNDLDKTVKIIQKLCDKRPDILEKIRNNIVFKTIKI